MADAVFPAAMAKEQDSKYFAVEQEDNAIKGETDGGYINARPRHTRRPRKTFTTGWTDVSHATYLIAQAFYDEVGTWKVFTYVDRTTGVTYRVRFDKPPKWAYSGMGVAKIWSCTAATLKEA
uniref:Phage tail protein n=1 Tax=Pseudomonas phage Nican01 TaxID=3138540 RepID=A0AAU6W0F5_9CAUD